MNPEDVPPGALLVDTNVVSWIALGEARSEEFRNLLAGHRTFISFVTLAEVKTFIALGVLVERRRSALLAALDDYTILPLETYALVSSWVTLRSATIAGATADDRERHQNDTWIAASALSADPPLPLATGNLRDFQPLADVSELKLIHPDL